MILWSIVSKTFFKSMKITPLRGPLSTLTRQLLLALSPTWLWNHQAQILNKILSVNRPLVLDWKGTSEEKGELSINAAKVIFVWIAGGITPLYCSFECTTDTQTHLKQRTLFESCIFPSKRTLETSLHNFSVWLRLTRKLTESAKTWIEQRNFYTRCQHKSEMDVLFLL